MNRSNKTRRRGPQQLNGGSLDSLAASLPKDSAPEARVLVTLSLAGVLMLAALLWAYWPTLREMMHQWDVQPDYSHGYLVLPIAMFFLWSRRDTIPVNALRPSLWGLIALLIAGALRVYAGVYYLIPLDGWTIPLTVAGVVWLLFGGRILIWCLPAIVFLWFMVPLPYSAETWLSVPLQRIATKLSTATLICLGQQAIAEGNTIFLGEHQLLVEEACSGLRILVGIVALAFAFVLFSRWTWWQKLVVLLAALPVAIVANVARVVVTGLLYQYVSGEAAHKFGHDVAGFVMIPFAALLFWMFLVYLEHLFPEVEDAPFLPIPQSTS